MNGNFKLFMGCLGNGITVCNKAVMENGNYKTIAHIGNNGKIEYYVSEKYIPVNDKGKIEKAAKEQKQKFLSYWNNLTDIQKYEKLLDMMSISDFLEVCKDKTHTLKEKVERLEKFYI